MLSRRRLSCIRGFHELESSSHTRVCIHPLLPILIVCSLGNFPAHGQTSPASPGSSQNGKICEETAASDARSSRGQASSTQTSREAQASRSSPAGSVEPLRLSIASDDDKAATRDAASAREKVSPPCPESATIPCRIPDPPPPAIDAAQPSGSCDPASQAPDPQPPVAAQDSAAPAAPAPPVVQFSAGKLTIRAQGEDFSSVMAAISAAAGIRIDVPSGTGSDPVFLIMGPASVREVLVALLDGGPYNYMLVGSRKDTGQVARVILSPQPPGDKGTVAAAPPQPHSNVAPPAEAEVVSNENLVPVQVIPSSIPESIPKVDVRKLAANEGKTVGEVLDELQKKQMDELDAQSGPDPGPPTLPQ